MNKRADREAMNYDVVVVGAGPAGLACAIRLKQAAPEKTVCVLEKGSEVGAHVLSGAVLDPRALVELLPDWKERQAPITSPAKDDRFLFLTAKKAFRLPTPPQMHNRGNYIISLGSFCKWLAQQAEMLGVEIYPGFAAAELLFDENGQVAGVATGDLGIAKNGEKTEAFQPGLELHAKQTVLAEGCHGSLTKQAIARFGLRDRSDPQTYGLGIKEVWEIDPAKHRPGLCIHTIGWPLNFTTYGGSWIYHAENNQVSIGYVVGLDYKNPYLSPFQEMQRFKTHPVIRDLLDGARRVSYGAKALSEGGLQSVPKLVFPGGLLIGDTAGFLNVPKIKGTHTAMKSGMLAADALAEMDPDIAECTAYPQKYQTSWLWNELYRVRNIRPGFNRGLVAGLVNAAFQTLGGWRIPFTLKNHADHACTEKADRHRMIDYPKPDGILTFDRLSSVYLSNTNHAENQPSHLKLRDPSIPIRVNLPLWAEPAQRYCPAAVYEIVEEVEGQRFQINAQNCVHCKTCDIKDPSQNIDWTVPQGGDGPNYTGM